MEGRPTEDSELIARAQRGDAVAYEALVRRTQPIAFRTAYLITGDAAEAEDVAQDAFVKAYYALARFRTGAPFRPWLLQIVVNEARNRRKAIGRRANLALRVIQDYPSSASAPSPEETVLKAEERVNLLRAMSGLRDEERLTIAYRYFFDLSEADIATALGCARGTVKSRLSRALDHLRGLLGVRRERPFAGGMPDRPEGGTG